jgi:hypothetical protein
VKDEAGQLATEAARLPESRPAEIIDLRVTGPR